MTAAHQQTRKKGGAERPWRSFWYFATRQGAARLGASFSGPVLALFEAEIAAASAGEAA